MLTDRECRTAKGGERPQKLFDAHGLYLYVSKTGHKSWRLKFRARGLEKVLTFGPYPALKLADARTMSQQARDMLRNGQDPTRVLSVRGQRERITRDLSRSFEKVARDWQKLQAPQWKARHASDVLASLENNLFPEPESAFHARVKHKVATSSAGWQLERMDPTAFITRIRDHYVDQFRAFAAQQRAHCTQGASEVKFQVNEQSELFDRLYCVDFIKNDGAVEMVELQPENILTFEPIAGAFGNSSLSIKHMRWDDVLIRHDLDEVPADRLSDWFQLWFDPEDARHVPGAELSEIIHSMVIQPHCISIDFGTAKPEAFWEILQLLDDAGTDHIEVSSSRAEAENEN